MFVDAREVEFGAVIKTDVCVVGGGIAGLTLARELDRRGIETCLLESGGFTSDRETRALSRGESVGVPHEVVAGSRSRYLGGASNSWDGCCQPLDDQDFAARDWVPHSGWPITAADLRPYYEQAHALLRLGPNNYDLGFWVSQLQRSDVRRLSLSTDRLVDSLSLFSSPESFGSLYRKELGRATRLRVFLYANVVEFETDPSGTAARQAVVLSLRGRKMFVTARLFVLAAGAIENARILLASNKARRSGLGNMYGLVGRYFMDHPSILAGEVQCVDEWKSNRLYDECLNRGNPEQSAFGTCFTAHVQLTPAVQRREGLLNSRMDFSSVYADEHPGITQTIVELKRALIDREKLRDRVPMLLARLARQPLETLQYAATHWLRFRRLVRGVRLHALIEPLPDPDSRVTLSDEQDELGMARVRVQWRLDGLVQRTFDRACSIFAEELDRAGIAKVSLGPSLQGRDWRTEIEFVPSHHQLGTTRMHNSPRSGVVDRHGLVHGMRNLFIAGGSVFPTAGAAPPALTVIALALRMADRLTDELTPSRPITKPT
jgi:choline dehydrogenase-like flavoprotein